MNRTIGFLGLLLFCFTATLLQAQVTMPSIFGSGMVLQRNQANIIWGTASKGEKVTITIAGQKHKVVTANTGHWKVKLDPIPAGGPYTLTTKGKTEITFTDILVGEVWLCTGQSNMAMPLSGGSGQHIEGSNEAILNSRNANLRFFTVTKAVSKTPLSDCKGIWEASEPKTAANFSAVGYAFGSRIQKILGVPVGLISCNVGGTPAQAWTPNDVIEEQFPEFKDELNKKYTNRTATGLYNGMVHPILPYTVKGAIWYQGEGNRWDGEQYSRLFPAMIKSWRSRWQQGDFPFYFVQLAPIGKQGEDWVKLQQAQLKTMLTVPNTGMAVINDIGDANRIHPPKKKEVGERLALWALAKDYGIEGIIHSGPVYKSMEVEKNKALLTFSEAPKGITSMGKPLKYFEVAGADHVFHPAKAKITKKGKVLQVWSEKVTQPKSVRYAWESYVEGCLFNTAGLPASAFSTDSWEVILSKTVKE